MTADPAQLTLPVHLRDDATLENFLFPDGLGVLSDALHRQLTAEGDHGIYVYGATGSGRSHLLQAACHMLPSGESLYLPLKEFASHSAVEVLDGIESLSRISLDDIDAVAGEADWEQALFHLVNRCRESGCRLLISADRAPRQLPIALKDLGSRLSGCLVFQLPDPSDARKLEVLAFRADRRGITLSEEAARYILARAPRGLGDLMDILNRLDRESMAAKRPLTIPFIKASLGW